MVVEGITHCRYNGGESERCIKLFVLKQIIL